MTNRVIAGPTPKKVQIEEEMHQSYMSYAMSVIVSRALPDVRDGLKPVHRRILYAMQEGGYTAAKPYRKSARIVGDVMGKYHPHGDSAIYDTLVRLAQRFSMSVPLIDGQGNFGSIDGDPPAAMRYTEARMSMLAHELTADLEKDTVKFEPTYDDADMEPTVLPAKFPNLLVNGASGIAVGMATNIPTHNIGEVVDACLLLVDQPEASLKDIMKRLPGPDFPTQGMIMGKAGILEAYETGRGKVTLSGVADVVDGKAGKKSIIITELPYGVNKAALIEKIAELVKEEKITGVAGLRDESDRKEPVRIVVDVKKDGNADLVLNKIRKDTRFVETIGINMVCLDAHGRPGVMDLKKILTEFLRFRRQVIRRRTKHDLNKMRDALHRQIGLYAAISMIDKVVSVIRGAKDPDVARSGLMDLDFPTKGEFAELLGQVDPETPVEKTFTLTEDQANAILALTLRSLTGLERDKIREKAIELSRGISRLVDILSDARVLDAVMIDELKDVKEQYGAKRQTKIKASEFEVLSEEDLVEDKDVAIAISQAGYVKRVDAKAYRQNAKRATSVPEDGVKPEEALSHLVFCRTKSPLVFFTSRGIAHNVMAHHLPEAAAASKGRSLANFMQLRTGETITAVVALPEDQGAMDAKSLIFVTDFGDVRRSAASQFSSIRTSGKSAIKLEGDDGAPVGSLVDVLLAEAKDDVMLFTSEGYSIRFQVQDLRIVGSTASTGVVGIKMGKDAKVVAGCVMAHANASQEEREAFLKGGAADVTGEDGRTRKVKLTKAQMETLRASEKWVITVSKNGFIKRSSSHEYRVAARGGKGIRSAKVTQATGDIVGAGLVAEDDDVLMLKSNGVSVRIGGKAVNKRGRDTRGSRSDTLGKSETLIGLAIIQAESPDEPPLL